MGIPRRVAAIVVNYSTPELTADCVGRLRAQDAAQIHVVVVDNTSSAAQSERLRQLLHGERIIETGRNLGFADGLNVGMRDVEPLNPDFLWVVTPDAAVAPGCLSAMLAAMDQDDRLGICGPVIDAAGEWIVGCQLFEKLGFWVRIKSVRPERIAALPATVATDFVEGCSMLIRADAAKQVGAFRLEFFLYYEECEYCLRARDLGWRMAVVPGALVRTRARKTERNKRSYYLIRNSIVLARVRKAHLVAAVARGLVEASVRAVRQPGFLTAGFRAVKDGLSLPVS